LNRGGTENLLLDVFKNARDEDLDIFCVYRNGGILHQAYKETGISLRKITPRGKFDLLYIFKLRAFLKKTKTEIAHAQQPLDALYAFLACLGLKTKVLFTMHGYDFSLGKLNRRIIRFAHKHTDLNIFVSKDQRDYFIEKYRFRKEKTRVIYNGISFEKFSGFAHRSLRHEFDIPQGGLLLGSVGNFNPVRDQMTICRFLKLLHEQKVAFTFIFAGSHSKAAPRYWDDCRTFCNEHDLQHKVIFAGSRNDIPNFLSQLDAFIYATDHDTFGIAVIEAMYMGIPVFINDWKVFMETTGGGKHGNFYRTKDENDLHDKFNAFLADSEKFNNKAVRDSKWVESQFSIQTHIKNLQRAYKAVLN
jgi:glycosyltransferase involved in cell wall biosynthesis